MRTGTRVNLTLPDDVVDVLDRLARGTGTGRATFVREWLIQVLPMLSELARAADLARARNADALTVAANALRDSAAGVSQMELDMRTLRRRAPQRLKKAKP